VLRQFPALGINNHVRSERSKDSPEQSKELTSAVSDSLSLGSRIGLVI
jgi:hypothetical protein